MDKVEEVANYITGFGCGVTASWDGCGSCEGLKDGDKCQGALEIAKQICQLFEPKPGQGRLLRELLENMLADAGKDGLATHIFEGYMKEIRSLVRAECETEYNKLLEAFKEVKIHRSSLIDEVQAKDAECREKLNEQVFKLGKVASNARQKKIDGFIQRTVGIIKEYALESASARDDSLEKRATGWKLLWQALQSTYKEKGK